jgi:hypothetical protein
MDSTLVFRTPAAKAKFADRKAAVQEAHKAFEESNDHAFQHAACCGDQLLAIKKGLQHGEFEKCLAHDFPDISRSSIKNYMRQARKRAGIEAAAKQKGQRAANLSQREALRLDATARGRSPAPRRSPLVIEKEKNRELEQQVEHLKEQLAAAECQGFVLERPRLISPTQQRFDEQGAMLREAHLRELHRDKRESEIASGAPVEVDDYDELMGPDPALVKLFESFGRPDELLIAAQNLVGVRFVDEDHAEWRIEFGQG